MADAVEKSIVEKSSNTIASEGQVADSDIPKDGTGAIDPLAAALHPSNSN